MNQPEPLVAPNGELRPIPDVTQRMVDHLDRLWPDRCPSPGEAPERVWFAAGAAAVVRALRRSLDPPSSDPGPQLWSSR